MKVLALETSCDETAGGDPAGWRGTRLRSGLADPSSPSVRGGGSRACFPQSPDCAAPDPGCCFGHLWSGNSCNGRLCSHLGSRFGEFAGWSGIPQPRRWPWLPAEPFVAVNHMEGHLLSHHFWVIPRGFGPCLSLIVSGGHTMLVALHATGRRYAILGRTRDDAAGEAFDKVGKMLGLPRTRVGQRSKKRLPLVVVVSGSGGGG